MSAVRDAQLDADWPAVHAADTPAHRAADCGALGAAVITPQCDAQLGAVLPADKCSDGATHAEPFRAAYQPTV